MKYLVSFSFLALLLIGCSSVREVGTSGSRTTSLETADIEQFLEKRNQALVSFVAEGTVVRSLNGDKQKGRFEMSLFKTDSLLLSLFGPFGIQVGKLQATPDYFQYYDALHNVAYEGEPHPDNMRKILQVPMSQTDMAMLMRGEVPGGMPGFFQRNDTEGNTWYYRETDTTVERLGISPESQAITEYTRKVREGETILSVRYSEFDLEGEIPMAKKVSFLFPAADMALFLRYDDLFVNKSLDSYVFKLPAGTKRNRF